MTPLLRKFFIKPIAFGTALLTSVCMVTGCGDDNTSDSKNKMQTNIISTYPAYYEKIKPIRMQDNLAKTLGASDGHFEYRFLDAAKTAGHVCPAVAGAWIETVLGLKTLYGDETPVRGRIAVIMKGSEDDGFTGAMANVIGLITGATNKQGFGGIFNIPDHNRQNLLKFKNDASKGPMYSIFTKLDENQQPVACVKVMYNPSAVPFKEEIKPLREKMAKGVANDSEKAEFASLWQERVERIMLDNFQNGINSDMIYTQACDVAKDL